MTIAISGTTGITLDGQFNSASSMGFKNRIINGAMVIAQRGTSAVTTDGGFPVDRFRFFYGNDGAYSAQQSTTAPAGFVNSIQFTTTTADASLGSTQQMVLNQQIEGFNCADLGWGTANAQPVTLSFWVRSSLTGTFGGSLRNNAQDRSYPFTYTIASANTWTQASVTIAGDTTGTWLTNNSTGISVCFGLGVGSTYSGTAGAWAGSDYRSATGAVSVIGTLNATFYITGVQLEKGSTATSFDYRPYGAELVLCQRYCFALVSNGENNSTFGGFWRFATGKLVIPISFPVTMRTSPTTTIPSGNNSWSVEDGDNPYTGTPTLERATPYNVMVNIPKTSNPSFASGYALAAHMFSASGTVCLLASAEL